MNIAEKFTNKSNAYAKARPDYPSEFINFLTNEIGITEKSIVADIGSGTGILSEKMLKMNCKTICIEINDDMRKLAEERLSKYDNFVSINATAENTTIESNSVDVITVAQAFHWFDTVKFKLECKRILKENGKVVLVWNSRDNDCELVKENAIIFQKYCPNFYGFSGGDENLDERISFFFDNNYNSKRCENNLLFDKDKFINRNLSASYSLKETDENYSSFISELENLFNKYAENNLLSMPNETVWYWGIE